MNIHPVHFIAGKKGGRLKLGFRSLLGWEGEGREGFGLGELALAEAGRSIHNLQAPAQPPSPSRDGVRWKVTQPSWTPVPVQRTACNITAWGGEFGKKGEGRGKQVAVSSSPLEAATLASKEGPRPPGAENLRPSAGEMLVQS